MTQSGRTDSESSRRRPSGLSRQASAIKRLRRRFSRAREPRVVFLGPCEVGKSALIARLRADVFLHDYEPTVCESLPYFMRLRSTLAETVQLVDVTGAPGKEYAAIRAEALDEGYGFVVVFSVKQRASFERVADVLEELAQRKTWPKGELGRRTILVGNQAGEEGWLADPDVDEDLVGEEEILKVSAPREVTKEEARRLAEQHGITEYVETSALTTDGVDSIPLRLGALFGAYAAEQEKSASLPRNQSLSQRMKSFLTKPMSIFEENGKEGKKSPTLSPTTFDRSSTTTSTAIDDCQIVRRRRSSDAGEAEVRPRPRSAVAIHAPTEAASSPSKSWKNTFLGRPNESVTVRGELTSPVSDVQPPTSAEHSWTRVPRRKRAKSFRSPPSSGRRKRTTAQDDAIGRYYGAAHLLI